MDMRNDDYERDEMNAIQRERMERRQATRRKSMITTAVFAGVGVLLLAAIIFGAVKLIGGGKKDQKTAPTTVTATISTEAKSTTAATQPSATQAQNNGQTAQQATQPAQVTATEAANSGSIDPALNNNTNNANNGENTNTNSGNAQGNAGGAVEGGNVLHYYANGQTSYGYDWNYSGGGGVVSIYCTYDFDAKQYDFTVTGVSEGTTSFTLYYNTDDGVQVPVPMTVSVDSNLNVTQIG